MAENKIIGEEEQPGRRLFSWMFTSLTVVASVITILPILNQSQTYQAAVLPPQQYTAPQVVHDSYVGQQCTLQSTAVSAKVTGYTARVTVKQIFHNPNSKRFDALYTFPLSDSAAVDDMTMKVGSRVVHGEIKKKGEARAIFQAAQQQGKTASLLEQKRTNIFTQSVANIEPGETIEVTLQYTDILAFENGQYSLVFPTKVGPRFMPSAAAEESRNGSAGAVSNWGTLAFDVDIDGGMPIANVHGNAAVDSVHQTTTSTAHLVKSGGTAGDDFIISWDVSTNAIESGVVTQRDGAGGYLTAMLMPPKHVSVDNVAPKEMVFLIDCSGSQSGPPLDKAKETLHYIVEHMNPQDTFQIVAFSNGSQEFAPDPVAVNADMKRRAHEWIEALTANGGTMMVPAIERVCSKPAPANRLRIVSFMTDGFVGNDYEVISLVKKLRGNSRWFPFGTGNGVNRTLIDGIAKEGGGEPEYVSLDKDGKAIAKEFYDRISSPVLTDVQVRFEGIAVDDIYPNQLRDVWAQKPLYIHAHFKGWGSGTAVVSGFAGGKPYVKRLPISLPAFNTNNEAVAQTWARAKIDDLMSQDLTGVQNNTANSEVEKQITEVALKHHLMSQYTSFVAVDNTEKTGWYNDATAPQAIPPQVSFNQVGYSSYTAQSTAPTGFFGQLLQPSFDHVVNQLNALNSYSASTSYANSSPVPLAAAAPTPAFEPAKNLSLLQCAALAIMWLACIPHLLRLLSKTGRSGRGDPRSELAGAERSEATVAR
jgi:Ca-activated chloride channel family protein